MRKKIFSIVMVLVLVLGIVPAVPVHAEGTRCPDCGEYWDTAGDGCFICARCSSCTEMCGRCDEMCIECHGLEEYSGDDEYAPCPDCGRCKGDGTPYCHECGRCEDCTELCEHCDYETCLDCHEASAGSGEEMPCPECGLCKANGIDYCTECGVCEECEELCVYCGLCPSCAEEYGTHCPECGQCCEDVGWCEYGGDHCLDCCEGNGWLCDECGECIEALGKDVCTVCGLCEECCEALRLDMGCTCSDVCWSELEDDHFCSDCGYCFGEVDPCEWCLDAGEYRCTDCCAILSAISGCDCGDPVCVNDPDWDDHFASVHAGADGLHDPKPQSAWSMNETHHWHACRYCDDEAHFSDRAAHSFGADGICSVCGFNRSAELFILIEPRDQKVKQRYWTEEPGETPDDPVACAVTFSVKVYSKNGSEDLSYQWYHNGYSLSNSVYPIGRDYTSGVHTAKLTTAGARTGCTLSYKDQYWCVITDSKGNTVTTRRAILTTEHNYRLLNGVGTDPAGHRLMCCGTGCEKLGPVEPHTYGAWAYHTDDSGVQDYKFRTCTVCGYEEKVYVHEHDYDFAYMYEVDYEDLDIIHEDDANHAYTYGFHHDGKYMVAGVNRKYHWIDCAAPGCDFTLKEEHQWGNWQFVTQVSPTKRGGAYQLCKICGVERAWSKTYYEWHTHPVNVTDGSANVDFAAEGSTVRITPALVDGKRVTGGTALIQYDQITSNASGKITRTPDQNEVIPLTALGSTGRFAFTVPTSGDLSDIHGAATIRDYKANPIEVRFTYETCMHPRASWKTVDAKDAACTSDGYTGDTVCGLCGHVMKKGEFIAPKGHGEPVPAAESITAKDAQGKTLLNRDGSPVYLVRAPQEVYCDDVTAKGCYSGDKVCPDCGEILETGKYTAKLHYYTLLDEIAEPARSKYIAAGLRTSEAAQPGISGYTGDMVCTVCEAVKTGRLIPALPEQAEPILIVHGVTLYDPAGKKLDSYANNGLSAIVLDCEATSVTPSSLNVLLMSYDGSGRFIGCALKEIKRSDLGPALRIPYACGTDVSCVEMLVVDKGLRPLHPMIPIAD